MPEEGFLALEGRDKTPVNALSAEVRGVITSVGLE